MSVIRTALILGCALGIHQTASAACTLNTQKIILSPEIVNDKQSIQSGGSYSDAHAFATEYSGVRLY
ncbi:Uncharacterised protein [Citrobacter freundii]|nr:Uncharacterised protein [Citrobacter freundii]